MSKSVLTRFDRKNQRLHILNKTLSLKLRGKMVKNGKYKLASSIGSMSFL